MSKQKQVAYETIIEEVKPSANVGLKPMLQVVLKAAKRLADEVIAEYGEDSIITRLSVPVSMDKNDVQTLRGLLPDVEVGYASSPIEVVLTCEVEVLVEVEALEPEPEPEPELDPVMQMALAQLDDVQLDDVQPDDAQPDDDDDIDPVMQMALAQLESQDEDESPVDDSEEASDDDDDDDDDDDIDPVMQAALAQLESQDEPEPGEVVQRDATEAAWEKAQQLSRAHATGKVIGDLLVRRGSKHRPGKRVHIPESRRSEGFLAWLDAIEQVVKALSDSGYPLAGLAFSKEVPQEILDWCRKTNIRVLNIAVQPAYGVHAAGPVQY